MKQQLLHTPEGVRDIYNGECEKKLYLEEKLHHVLNIRLSSNSDAVV